MRISAILGGVVLNRPPPLFNVRTEHNTYIFGSESSTHSFVLPSVLAATGYYLSAFFLEILLKWQIVQPY